jgi:hypothetical protein
MTGSKLALLTTAAFLAASLGVASAQTTSPGSSPSAGAAANQGKCWDEASKQIKDKSAMAQSGSSSAAKSGSAAATTGAAGSTSATAGKSSTASAPSGSSASAGRPAAAAGLPNC